VVSIPPAPQHADGVDRGHEEARHQVRREDHVGRLVGHRPVEERVECVDVGGGAVLCELEAVRLIHPRVRSHHRPSAAKARDRDRDARPEVRPPGQALPAVDVDGDEDRLGEEEDALERERKPEHVAEAAHELGPEQAHLEREHRPRDRADHERDGRDLRPALGEPERVGVVALQPQVVGGQDYRGEADAERGHHDVEAERESHLAPRGTEIGGQWEEVETHSR
jgi:hypothetical protein